MEKARTEKNLKNIKPSTSNYNDNNNNAFKKNGNDMEMKDFRDKTVYFGTVPLGRSNYDDDEYDEDDDNNNIKNSNSNSNSNNNYNSNKNNNNSKGMGMMGGKTVMSSSKSNSGYGIGSGKGIGKGVQEVEEYNIAPEREATKIWNGPLPTEYNVAPPRDVTKIFAPQEYLLPPELRDGGGGGYIPEDQREIQAQDEDVPQEQQKYQIKVQRKKVRPKLVRQKKTNDDGTEVEATYAGKLHENIRLFFQYNDKNLVRAHVKVDESEKTKARTWVFFLIILQLVLSVIYAFAMTTWIDPFFTLSFIALCMALLFGLKFISLIIFYIRKARTKCLEGEFDPESEDFDNIFICIPAYNEDIAAFSRTISSICNSYYPRSKMYMLFIVDGNKDKSFESLMEVLQDGKKFEEHVPGGIQRLEQGVYRGVNYSVYLKDFNRGKRDSQWLFVEIMRNMIPTFKPPFCFFVDSDTAFTPHSIRYLYQAIKVDDKISGVCGQLQLSNWETLKRPSLDCLFSLSAVFVVGYQQYEYYFNQIIGKQCEAAYYSVTCLPGAFSMLRTSVLTNIEARYDEQEDVRIAKQIETNQEGNKMDAMQFMYLSRVRNMIPLVLDDFFSKPTIGIVARNLYELGEDRTLTVKMLEKGLKTTYEPRAIAYTECPDTIGKLIQQRRRWNNSTFVNLAVMIIRPALWLQFKTFPVMVFTLFDLVGSYFLPVNAILFTVQVWDPLFKAMSSYFDFGFSLDAKTFLTWWLTLQLIVMLVTKMPDNEMYFIISTFVSGLAMLGSLYFMGKLIFYEVVVSFIRDPASNWPLIIITYIFPFLHLITSATNPLMFLTMVFFLIMFPTVIITVPLNAFLRLDDFSWGTRD